MTPIERLKKAVTGKKLLQELGFQRITGGGNLRACCAIHGGDNPSAFVYTEHNGMYFCHTGCMEGGDFIDLVMRTQEVTFLEAVKWLSEIFNVHIDWENETIEENYFRDEARAFIEQMMKKKKVTELPAFKLPQDMKLSKITSFRDYSQETIDWWKFRFCEEGELKDRIMIPFEDVDGRLVGVTGRATLPEQKEKFLHRPRNLHTGFFLTGLGRNKKAGHIERAGGAVKIVEGVFDGARWYEAGFKSVCAPIGVFFTDEHVLQLYRAGVTRIELGFDNDKAGRNGMRKAYERAKGKFEVFFLVYPEGKDADDCTPEELAEVDANKMLPHEWFNKFGKEVEK
jgi:DNA primase